MKNPHHEKEGLVYIHPRLPVYQRKITEGIILNLWHPALGEWSVGLQRTSSEPLLDKFPAKKVMKFDYAGNKFAVIILRNGDELEILDGICATGTISVRQATSHNTFTTQRKIIKEAAQVRHAIKFVIDEGEIQLWSGTTVSLQIETTAGDWPIHTDGCVVMWKGVVLATMSFKQARRDFVMSI